MDPLNEKGIDTEDFEALMIAKFTDNRSAAYSPDDIMFPFQTYELLANSEML